MRKEMSKAGKAGVKKIMDKLYALSSKVEDEYDIMELIEDNIKDIFSCNLDCSTCSTKEQGNCMQPFKKANLYLLRKLYLDEVLLKEFTQDILDMIDLVAETRDVLETEKTATEKESREMYKKRFDEIREKSKKNIGYVYHI